MNRTDGRSSTATRGALMVSALALLASPTCAQQRVGPAVVPLASARTVADSVRLVLERNRPTSARADTMYETLPGMSDDQRLMKGTCPARCRYGPRALIQPHKAAVYITERERASGVTIARIINLDDSAYGKFNLQAHDTVYWVVSMRRGEPVSIFYSSVRGVAPVVSDLDIERHPNHPYRQALARWIWNDRDEEAWATCDGGACCRSTGVER